MEYHDADESAAQRRIDTPGRRHIEDSSGTAVIGPVSAEPRQIAGSFMRQGRLPLGPPQEDRDQRERNRCRRRDRHPLDRVGASLLVGLAAEAAETVKMVAIHGGQPVTGAADQFRPGEKILRITTDETDGSWGQSPTTGSATGRSGGTVFMPCDWRRRPAWHARLLGWARFS